MTALNATEPGAASDTEGGGAPLPTDQTHGA
jgi:hypothetical protein